MDFGFVVLIIFVSGILGTKKALLGSVVGTLIAFIQYFYFQDFQIKSFAITGLIGIGVSFFTAFFVSTISSGYKGGNHNTGPSYMGGFGGGRGGAPPGGIILSDEERQNNKKK